MSVDYKYHLTGTISIDYQYTGVTYRIPTQMNIPDTIDDCGNFALKILVLSYIRKNLTEQYKNKGGVLHAVVHLHDNDMKIIKTFNISNEIFNFYNED